MAHPLDPLLARLALQRVDGLGARGAALLCDRLGPPETVLALDVRSLVSAGVPAGLAARLVQPSLLEAARTERDEHAVRDHALLGWDLPGYPESLDALADPPLILSVRGSLTAADQAAVAIVGARRGDPPGQEVARELARELALAGLTIVSGLARGIDRAAHEGALEVGGRTIAVLGTGLARIYPPQHHELAERIVSSGALLSELPPRARPTRWSFPQRNRTIAGLTQGVVVVQAGARSGALITADFALQLGRELFAVPGAVYDPLARGPNGLIKDGARLIESARDVLEVLRGVQPQPPELTQPAGPPLPPALPRALPGREHVSGRLVTALGQGPQALEPLARAAGVSPDEAARALALLELEGAVSLDPSGVYRAG